MADSSSDRGVNSQLTSKVQETLKSWREVVIIARDVLLWTQSHHAAMIGGIVTAIFLLIWLLDATVLTTVSMIGFTITVADYIVPLVLSSLFDPANWTEVKEKIFVETCNEIAGAWGSALELWTQWNELKVNRPKVYSGLLLSILITLAWIGNLFNNLLLTFLVTTFAALYPGLKKHGLIEKHLGSLIATIKATIGDKLKQH